MLPPLVLGGLLSTQLGQLLVAIVVLAVIVLVGRFVLHVAWRLLVIAGIVVALLYVLTALGLA